MPEENAGVAVSVSIIVSVFLSLVCLSNSCAEFHACTKAKTCAALDTKTCSFQNTVSPAGYKLFNTTSEVSTLAELERGVCAPGERQNMIFGGIQCFRQRVFPSALNVEIMKPSALTDHERACGAWLDAGSTLESSMWAFYDEKDVETEITSAMNARLKIRGGINSPSQFRAACTRMIVSNSEGPAGMLAYEHLKRKLPLISNENSALRAIGFLAGHYCDTPALLGLSFQTSRQVGLVVNLTEGVLLKGSQLDEWLYASNENSGLRADASSFADFMQNAVPTPITHEQAREVFVGAVDDTVTDTAAPMPYLYMGGTLPTLSRFVAAHAALGPQKTHAYLLGLASRCAFAVRSAVTGEFGYTGASATRDSFPGGAAALGRLYSQRESGDRLKAVSSETVLDATTVTWSRLRRPRPLTSYAREHAVQACDGALAAGFPDQLDEIAFDLLVSQTLYDRIGTLAAELRPAVASTLMGPIFAPTLVDPVSASSIVSQAQIRIPGAPHSTWAGRSSAIANVAPVDFTSSDGALVMLLKQSQNLFLNRMALVKDGHNGVCDLPPIFHTLSRNAYFLPAHGCSVLLPGILVAPFASESYDDMSLRARIGFVIAHEFAHATAAVPWNTLAMNNLLIGYPRSTQAEAVADLAAVTSIASSYPSIGNDTLCLHLSQMWCSRMPRGLANLLYIEARIKATHPPPNERGNLICAFLRKHY